MNSNARARWGISLASLITFILIFFIFFTDTAEFFSSMSAALLGALLIFGTLVTIGWCLDVFRK